MKLTRRGGGLVKRETERSADRQAKGDSAMSASDTNDFIPRKGRILPLSERVGPSSTALVVVDVQNDFCDPNGAFGKLGNDVSMMPAMAACLHQLIEAARRRGMLIIWVRATYDAVDTSAALAETYNRRGFHQSQCMEGSWGADWYGVAPNHAANEIVLTKHRFSPFWDTAIDLYLRSNGIRSVVVTGVVTSGCVESTVRDAFFNDYYTVVAQDCVAEASSDRHQNALAKMAQAFGQVMPAAEIMKVWDGNTHNAPAWRAHTKRDRLLYDRRARLNPMHSALLLVDLQNDFCDASGAMGQRAEGLVQIRAVIPRIADLLRQARSRQVLVMHVKAEYGEADASDVRLFAEQRSGSQDVCVPGTWGAAIIPEVAPAHGEPVVVKRRFSGFVDTGLEKLLRANRIRTLVVAGVATQCCVECTVRDAALRDFYVVVPDDCVAARDRMRHLHDASLETMATYFADVFPSSEITTYWRVAPSPS
jgi:nicotinamidase-related amidase